MGKVTFHLALSLILILTVPFLALFFVSPVFAQTGSGPGPGIPAFEVSPEILAAIAGVVLSLFFNYFPGINTKFAALDPTYKRLIMAALLLITAVALYGLNCAAIIQASLTCDRNGIIQLVWIFIWALIANQSAFSISPQTNAVKEAKQFSDRLNTLG